MPRLLFAIFGCVLLLSTSAVASASASAQPSSTRNEGPETPLFSVALAYSLIHWDVDAPGSNDWSCRPSAAHPRPVVLVHGTWANRYHGFARMAPALKRAGYCVFALDYGDFDDNGAGLHPAVKGTGDLRRSAGELAAFVERVRTTTGSSKVDIVGHSQGGMMPRWYLKFLGGADKVHTLVTLGATHHGTTLSGLGTLAETFGLLGLAPLTLGEAARQQVRGSAVLEELNAGGDTLPGITYVVLATRYDEVTTPYDSTFLTAGPGATVRNITLQDGCGLDFSDHLSIVYSPRAIGYVKQGLDPAAGSPPCVPHFPVV